MVFSEAKRYNMVQTLLYVLFMLFHCLRTLVKMAWTLGCFIAWSIHFWFVNSALSASLLTQLQVSNTKIDCSDSHNCSRLDKYCTTSMKGWSWFSLQLHLPSYTHSNLAKQVSHHATMVNMLRHFMYSFDHFPRLHLPKQPFSANRPKQSPTISECSVNYTINRMTLLDETAMEIPAA